MENLKIMYLKKIKVIHLDLNNWGTYSIWAVYKIINDNYKGLGEITEHRNSYCESKNLQNLKISEVYKIVEGSVSVSIKGMDTTGGCLRTNG